MIKEDPFSDFMNRMVTIYYDLLEIHERILAVSSMYNLSTDDFSIFMLLYPIVLSNKNILRIN